mmetsp:Transcript_32/g.58  ORF Transcript_32/g.58 Transcript_32/m.58 type:complete len:1981 (-) Transcript_32:168-6110(-)
MEEDIQDEISFGKSQFKGKKGFAIDLYRWWIQFVALLLKNFLILIRRPVQLAVMLCLPSAVFFTFLIQRNGGDSDGNSSPPLYPAIPISDLGDCDVHYGSKCVRVVYGPESEKTNDIMTTFSDINDLSFGSDVRGFETVDLAQEFVASHIGMVQFTVLFRNDSLWETTAYSPDNIPLEKNLSYVIFYNSSRNNDVRSKEYKINFPLLVVEKTIEESYMRVSLGNAFEKYDVNYGQLWAVPSGLDDTNQTLINSTKCDLETRPHAIALGTTLPWVLVFAVLFLSNVCFQVVAEERRKKLFTSLRRLGLLDTAYWASWFVALQIVILTGASLSLVVAAAVRPHSSSLRGIDLSLMLLLLWLTGSACVSMSLFLAAFCSSSSVATSLAFTQFLIALATLSAATDPLNSYDTISGECFFVASSYNKIYSTSLLGHTFVQFLVFFLPFFHSAQAVTDIISVVQYKHQNIRIGDLGSPIQMVYDSTSTSTFDSKWVGWALKMLAVNTVLYLFLAWLTAEILSSDVTEGRPLLSVLIPPSLRRFLTGSSGTTAVEEGDVRGEEKKKSGDDRSVRAYKVSKTYSGVQALKEVSLTMKRGECFVMLGHNGAGKSTLINIITGIVSPTHGKVFINGLDSELDQAEIQQTIGVCSQDDLVWDELTAREHMLLTAVFKGLNIGPELYSAVDTVLNMVQLKERANEFCSQYSGGMKRRLSVAMSTVGDVEILFLDEPTTGLDPVSRRKVWEAIHAMKKDRVVVLTTHNMEEADFLGDTIMIMHGGHVRALGDPLFLKQTFGRGYQVNLCVRPGHIEEARDMVARVLPDANCTIDETSCAIYVTVPRQNVVGLPRIFAWLENSSRASSIVTEWGVSNTTLEQVFLSLCAQNTEINMSAMSDTGSSREFLCPMCRVRRKDTVFMRNMSGQAVVVPESLCWICASENEHFVVDDEDVNHALLAGESKDKEVSELLKSAHRKAEAFATKHILDLEAQQEDVDIEGVNWDSPLLTNGSTDQTAASAFTEEEFSQDFKTSDSTQSANGSQYAQIHALVVKNIVLQSRQKCSNICSVLFVGVMFLMLYLISLLFGPLDDIKQCGQGYLSVDGCSMTEVVDHIFSGSDNDMANDDWWDDDDVVGPYGYNVKNYLVPSQYGVTIFGTTDGIYNTYGLPVYDNRYNIVWMSSLNSTKLQSADTRGLYFTSRSPPSSAAGTTDAPNDAMYSSQELVYENTLTNGYPQCSYYAPDTVVGDYSTENSELAQSFSDVFADTVFSCPTCPVLNPGEMPSTPSIYFDGTFWLSAVSTKSCESPTCKKYPYGYINYKSDSVNSSNMYLGEECPLGIEVMEMNQELYYYDHDQTMHAMTYLNLLSNVLLQPTLETYSMQGGYSEYGELSFDAVLISQAQSNILTVLAMMLLNGFWPLAVWRLSHERSQNIVLMMRTVGMRASSYIFGMFFFDMVVSVLSGIAMLVFAVEMKLSQFKGAPVGYLVAVVLLSAFALNAGALLMVQLLGKRSSILPMIAPCFCIGMTAATSLLNVFLFQDDGEWPWYLSIIPFFAQGRALYIILVYHRTSNEVDTALALLTLFGLGCLILVYILEAEIPVLAIAAKRWKKFYSSADDNDENYDATRDLELRLSSSTRFNSIEGVTARVATDDDVIEERRRAVSFTTHRDTGRDSLLAIVIKELRHIFPNGTVAVKDLSLALNYGECFGLLGPNGTGKSTTISILSGTLKATYGEVYVAGSDLRIDTTAVHRYVGICPQFDVVWPDMTVEEHLAFQARQRGTPGKRIYAEVQKAAVAVGLDGDGFHTKAGELSGGMRRRLSIAMSVVGNPPIVFMDEPTTGLDPDNKNHVWKIIQSLKTPDRLILMTTHSMEEAEALCNRIGIMARGELQCIGSPQHLKTKFGKGFTLTVNLIKKPGNESTNNEDLTTFVRTVLNGCLLSSINATRKFVIQRDQSIHISHIFKQMELNKARLGVREWGLSMSTLEDVFISAVNDN